MSYVCDADQIYVYFSRFQSCASDEHWNHLKRVLRYSKGSLTMKLVYEKHERSENIFGYADADWANDIEDRKAITGYVLKVLGNRVLFHYHQLRLNS
jgi:hypothetical protein